MSWRQVDYRMNKPELAPTAPAEADAKAASEPAPPAWRQTDFRMNVEPAAAPTAAPPPEEPDSKDC